MAREERAPAATQVHDGLRARFAARAICVDATLRRLAGVRVLRVPALVARARAGLPVRAVGIGGALVRLAPARVTPAVEGARSAVAVSRAVEHAAVGTGGREDRRTTLRGDRAPRRSPSGGLSADSRSRSTAAKERHEEERHCPAREASLDDGSADCEKNHLCSISNPWTMPSFPFDAQKPGRTAWRRLYVRHALAHFPGSGVLPGIVSGSQRFTAV
jgi:hypothetical protein